MTAARHSHNPLTGPLVAWGDDFTAEQFIADLVRQARHYARPNGPVLILGNAEITDAVGAALIAAGLATIRPPERQSAAVAIADPDPRSIHTEWQRVANDPELRTVPVVYRPRARGAYPLLTRHDDLIARGLASDRRHYITSAFDSGVEEQVYACLLERVTPSVRDATPTTSSIACTTSNRSGEHSSSSAPIKGIPAYSPQSIFAAKIAHGRSNCSTPLRSSPPHISASIPAGREQSRSTTTECPTGSPTSPTSTYFRATSPTQSTASPTPLRWPSPWSTATPSAARPSPSIGCSPASSVARW